MRSFFPRSALDLDPSGRDDVARLAPDTAPAPGERLASLDGAASLVNPRGGNLAVYSVGRADRAAAPGRR